MASQQAIGAIRTERAGVYRLQQLAAAWVGASAGVLLGAVIGAVAGAQPGMLAVLVLGGLGWLRGRYNGAFRRASTLLRV